jgi:hypothetical protein
MSDLLVSYDSGGFSSPSFGSRRESRVRGEDDTLAAQVLFTGVAHDLRHGVARSIATPAMSRCPTATVPLPCDPHYESVRVSINCPEIVQTATPCPQSEERFLD